MGAKERSSWPSVRKRTLKVLKSLGSEIPTGPENQRVVLEIIQELLWDDLSSGTHHIYRGVLSAGGRDRKALFVHFEMVRFSKKLMGIAESNQVLRELDLAIKAAG